jgi:hypothetical protein
VLGRCFPYRRAVGAGLLTAMPNRRIACWSRLHHFGDLGRTGVHSELQERQCHEHDPNLLHSALDQLPQVAIVVPTAVRQRPSVYVCGMVTTAAPDSAHAFGAGSVSVSAPSFGFSFRAKLSSGIAERP